MGTTGFDPFPSTGWSSGEAQLGCGGTPLPGCLLQRAPQEQCRRCAETGLGQGMARSPAGPDFSPPVLPLPLVPTGVGLDSPTQEDPAVLEEV